ncbi:MAG: PEP/pyruvate-binding domain-containing protein [Planctomycetota bacterium]
MSDQTTAIEGILKDLAERAKELNCLYTVEELLSNPDAPLDRICKGVIEAIPSGWQFPGLCQARLTCEGVTHETPGHKSTPWVMRSAIQAQGQPIGTLEVSYTEAMPAADEGPFLQEERKLIDTIADRLGSCVTHRRLVEAMRDWRAARREAAERASGDWQVILELLRRTDPRLLVRITRKMINHLTRAGVTEADRLLQYLGLGSSADQQRLVADANQPLETPGAERVAPVDEVFRFASRHLSDGEIVACIHEWIKHDRARFLVHTVEDAHASLAEVADAIRRYHHATHGEVQLSPVTLKGLRVSLVHRFMTGQLEFINVAKDYLEIADFYNLLQRLIYPSDGYGKIGGKGSGLLLAERIVRRHQAEVPEVADLRTPRTWYITADGLSAFVDSNDLEDLSAQKYKDLDTIRQEYPDVIQLFRHSQFPADLRKGLSVALDEFGEQPLIVRSSSLLEDRFGAAFSGKYKSLFLANQGTKAQRLAALCHAIAEVYASVFSPDPIEYRAERNLLDFQEGMGILIQEVVGRRVGPYFLPAFAGVAFSQNEFRWSPRIRRDDGLARFVPGLGTRAVDRLGDDYPVLVSPGQPGLRVNATPEEAARYAPRYLDVINLEKNAFETIEAGAFLREYGAQVPAVEQLVSIYEHGRLRQPLRGQIDFAHDDLVVTFDGLLTRTPLLKQLEALLALLQAKLRTPVDVEFASDGEHLYLLQCRAQSPTRDAAPAPIPREIPQDRLVFSAHRHVSNGSVPEITHVVYVDAEHYGRLAGMDALLAVGRAVSRLNKVLPKRQFILIGPGRWGSRGDIKLGVRVTYSDINNTAMLIEVARRKGDSTPDLSFGTHFFQDLVEASIRYLPLYPDEEGVHFNEAFLTRSLNILPRLAPEFAALAETVRVIDVPKVTDGKVLTVLMNADLNEAVAVLVPPGTAAGGAVSEAVATPDKPTREQDWRWRMRMAERLAAQLDPERFGVQALYVLGSVKNATAGPASDIDLLVHFRGSRDQRAALEQWLHGWSVCLSEVNFMRTGYQSNGLLDIHVVTDEDIAARTSFAAKINAVTDAARPLALKPRGADAAQRGAQ